MVGSADCGRAILHESERREGNVGLGGLGFVRGVAAELASR